MEETKMKFHDLLRLIVDSQADQWHTITCWGAGSGPSYKDRFEFWNTYNAQANVLKADSHSNSAVFREDVAISLAWGLQADATFAEPWATTFPDPKASRDFVDVFYNNSLVYRDTYIVVDGGRACLPMPESADSLTVPRGYASLIRLIDELGLRTSDYDSYFKRAGFSEVDTGWPS
jgi:hypothetical protein